MLSFIQKINKFTGYLVSFLMGLMVLDVSWQVFTRYVLRKPSPFSEELAGFFLIWVSLLGAAYAFFKKAHLGIDILTSKLNGFRKQCAEVAVQLVIAFFAFLVMVIGGMRLMAITFRLNQLSPALGIPMGYVYLIIPVSGMLIILYSIGFMTAAIKNKSLLSKTQKDHELPL